MYRTIDDVFPLSRFREVSERGGLRIGVTANIAGHTRELCAAVYIALTQRQDRIPVEVFWQDDGRDAQVSQRAAELLLDQQVHAVIGHLSASASVPAAHHYNRKCLFFAPATSHPDLLKPEYETIFRLYGRDDDQSRAMIQFLRRVSGPAKVALLEQDIAYGRVLAKLVRDSWPQAEWPSPSRFVLPADADKRALVYRAIEDFQPDIVLFAGIHEMAVDAVTALKSRISPEIVLLSDDIYVADFLRLVGNAADGAYVMAINDAGNANQSRDLMKQYFHLTGEPAGAYFFTSYAAIQIILGAADEAGYDDPREMAHCIRSRVWDTCLGNLSFLSNGELDGVQWGVLRVRGDSFEPSNGIRSTGHDC